MSTASKSAVDVFGFDQQALACPAQIFESLRTESGPVVFLPDLGLYFALDYESVTAAVRNPEVFSSTISAGESTNRIYDTLVEKAKASGELDDLIEGYGSSDRLVLAFADPPAHTRHRSLINRAFSPPRVRTLEPNMRTIADRLIDAFIDNGRVELMSEYATALSIRVIASALRCPDDDVPTLKQWADDFLAAIASSVDLEDAEIERFAQSRLDFDRYFTNKLADVRANPGDDLLSDIVHGSAEAEQPLTADEMLMMFQEFLVGGTETAALAMGSMVVHLTEDPELADRLRGDESLLAPFVEESLRWDHPAQVGFRTATRDTVLGGVDIPAGSTVILHWACASRDPAVFSDPDEFDLERKSRKAHLAFGQGIHLCVGAGLARAEIRIGLERLLARLDDIALAADPASLDWVPSVLMHGRTQVPLTFTART